MSAQQQQRLTAPWSACTYLLVLGLYLSEMGWDGFAISTVVLAGLVFLSNFIVVLGER